MGGRGADGGNLGGGGGSSINVISETDLWDYRHKKENERYVDNINEVIRDVTEEYHALEGGIYEVTMGKFEGKDKYQTLAFWSEGGKKLCFNQNFGDVDKVQKAYDESVEQGFHPSRGNKTGEQAIALHELGHSLTGAIATKWGKTYEKTARSIVDEARRTMSGKHKGSLSMAKCISDYATHSNEECIAEAFADVKCNGRKAKAESKAIVKILDKYLK